MKAITTLILSLIINTVIGQDIQFSTKEEIEEAVVYLNKLRHSKEFVKQETGVEVKSIIKMDLTIDSTLCELAKLRVIEMIENDELSHNTKYDTKWYAECCNYNWDSDIKSHIIQYIIDRGVPSLGHRMQLIRFPNKIVGIATGTIGTKTFSCFLFSDGYEEIYIALK